MQTALDIIIIVLLVIAVVMLGIVILNQLKKASDNSNSEEFKRLEQTIRNEQSALRQELTSSTQMSVKNLGDMIAASQNAYAISQSKSLAQLEERLKTFSLTNEQQLDNIRQRSWISSRRILSPLSTKATWRCRRSAACSPATARARRALCATGFGFPARLTTARSISTSF